jgi:hypothetical protein
VFPQFAVSCKIEAECSYQTFLQVDSELLRNRQLLKPAKRYPLHGNMKIKKCILMNAKNFVLISFLNLTSIFSYGQVEKDSLRTVQNIERKAEIIQLEAPIYKLFPTQNTWASLKLDTRNGRLWQVHYSVSKEGYEGTLSINSYSLVLPEEEINGRFNLYPTENMFNFILLDQINGNTYKVQWHNDNDKRFIRRIY